MDHDQTLELYSGSFFRNLRRRFWRGQWMWPAAIILFLLSFALWQWFGRHMIQVRAARNGVDNTTNIHLPDQTYIVLQPDATLRYHKQFTRSTQREVWLSGAGDFQVPPNSPYQPKQELFTVHTTAMDAMTEGSRFRVTTEGPATTVLLYSGKITVHFKNKNLQDIVLSEGEMLKYPGAGKPVIQKTPAE
ncbi:FecR domain-containing protein [uncultured Chitinophaga sp.]|jgi:Fe2+-dicitrate sensor, membrane component|uniref:FecR family protein n=1 Tax=uncultured Chitinophaga sp. TaxID=339340 RepID=UPI00260D4BB9|nr:FecR domain-containing protein [uncultured Chitinophaga sp.]